MRELDHVGDTAEDEGKLNTQERKYISGLFLLSCGKVVRDEEAEMANLQTVIDKPVKGKERVIYDIIMEFQDINETVWDPWYQK